MVLGKSIYQSNGKLLLGAGFRVAQEIRTKLLDRGIPYVYIMEEGTEDVVPEDVISDEIRYQSASVLSEKAGELHNILQFKNMGREKLYSMIKSGCLKDIPIHRDTKAVVQEIMNDISSAGVRFMNTVLYKSKDTYLMDHSANSAIIAILIGKKFRFSQPELLNLALGTFLHDFGKIIIERLRESAGAEVAEELMREHPTFGYLILQSSRDASPVVNQIVNQHHEYQDGSGYPIGLKGQNLPPLKTVKRETKGTIYRMAEICCVASEYDRLVMNPHDPERRSPADAMKVLIRDAGAKYNKHIVSIMHQVIPFFPVGAYVRVKNAPDRTIVGFRGVVAKVNEQALDNPTVILLVDREGKRIKPFGIDSTQSKNMELDLIM